MSVLAASASGLLLGIGLGVIIPEWVCSICSVTSVLSANAF